MTRNHHVCSGRPYCYVPSLDHCQSSLSNWCLVLTLVFFLFMVVALMPAPDLIRFLWALWACFSTGSSKLYDFVLNYLL